LGKDYSLVFKCVGSEAFNIQVGPLQSETLLSQTENEFKLFVQSKGYTALGFGRFQVGGKEHVWARYYMGDDVWTKKYLITFGKTEYAITATCFTQNMLLQREKIWDEIAASFQFSKTHYPSLSNILSLISQPARLGDIPKRIELCEQALAQVPRLVDPKLWAGLHMELAISHLENTGTK
jgi:hypothetical protein